jgi:hypothetical protein
MYALYRLDWVHTDCIGSSRDRAREGFLKARVARFVVFVFYPQWAIFPGREPL